MVGDDEQDGIEEVRLPRAIETSLANGESHESCFPKSRGP